MDMYHSYSCLAAREVLVPCMALGQKMQLMPSKGSTLREAEQRWRQLGAGKAPGKLSRAVSPYGQCSPPLHSRCMSTEPAAQPACSICCGLRPCSPSHVRHMLRGRDSPVRSALQDCWMDASRHVERDAVEAAAKRKVASLNHLEQHKLLTTLEALDQAAARLRSKLALTTPVQSGAAAAAADVAIVSQRVAVSCVRSSHMHSSPHQPRGSVRTPSPGRRHWVP